MAKWETFKFHGSRGVAERRVSLNTRGVFTLNQIAFDEIGNPVAVEMLYDREARLIGLKPSTLEVEYAVKVRQQGKNKSYLIGAKSFCQYYKLDVTDTIRFTDIDLEDGMLVLDLAKTELVEIRGGKKKGSTKTGSLFLS